MKIEHVIAVALSTPFLALIALVLWLIIKNPFDNWKS